VFLGLFRNDDDDDDDDFRRDDDDEGDDDDDDGGTDLDIMEEAFKFRNNNATMANKASFVEEEDGKKSGMVCLLLLDRGSRLLLFELLVVDALLVVGDIMANIIWCVGVW